MTKLRYDRPGYGSGQTYERLGSAAGVTQLSYLFRNVNLSDLQTKKAEKPKKTHPFKYNPEFECRIEYPSKRSPLTPNQRAALESDEEFLRLRNEYRKLYTQEYHKNKKIPLDSVTREIRREWSARVKKVIHNVL